VCFHPPIKCHPFRYVTGRIQVPLCPLLSLPLFSEGVHVVCQSLVLDVLCHYQQVFALLIYTALVYNYTLFYSQAADDSDPGSDARGDDILDMVDTLQVILAEPPEPLERPSLPPPPEEAAPAVQPALSAVKCQEMVKRIEYTLDQIKTSLYRPGEAVAVACSSC